MGLAYWTDGFPPCAAESLADVPSVATAERADQSRIQAPNPGPHRSSNSTAIDEDNPENGSFIEDLPYLFTIPLSNGMVNPL